jgi:hypothetical protein
MMSHRFQWRMAVVRAAAATAGSTIVWNVSGAHPEPAAQKPATVPLPPLAKNGLGLDYTPMPPTFQFQPKPVVDGWVKSNNVGAMIEHAWEIWGGLSTEVEQTVGGQKVKYPTFETWVDEFTVFPQPSTLTSAASLVTGSMTPTTPSHRFTKPKQLLKRSNDGRHLGEAALQPTSPTPRVVTVKYTKEIYEGVWSHQYYRTDVMNTLNQGWTKTSPPTPLADRNVEPFDDRSIMIKPTYQIVKGKVATLVNYWTGPAASTTPSSPAFPTWTNKMLVLPPGMQGVSLQGVPNVSVDQFYHFQLNKTEAAYINGMGQGTFEEGDYAILVAMHVSSREIDKWTWQTFWWSIEKPKIPAAVAGRIAPPFDHYDAAVGYSYTTGPDSPAGLNVVCFNPYLEADFDNSTFVRPGQLGIESNCMSCHRAAAWPAPNLPNNAQYLTANGILKPDDPYFQGMTKVDFVWGFGDDVPAPPTPATGGP